MHSTPKVRSSMNESQATHDNSLIVVGKSKNNKGKCTINFCGNKLMPILQLFGRERYQQTRVKKYPQCYNKNYWFQHHLHKENKSKIYLLLFCHFSMVLASQHFRHCLSTRQEVQSVPAKISLALHFLCMISQYNWKKNNMVNYQVSFDEKISNCFAVTCINDFYTIPLVNTVIHSIIAVLFSF